MGKKKLKKRIKFLEFRVEALTKAMVTSDCHYCENHKPKTVTFSRYIPLPKIDMEGSYERTTGSESSSKKD